MLGTEQKRAGRTEPSLVLTPDEAIRCLDAILSLQVPPPLQRVDDFGNATSAWANVGAAVAVGILPVLDPATVGAERLDRLSALLESRALPSTAHAWPEMVRLDPSRQDQAVTAIVVDLLSGGDERVHAALRAVECWRTIGASIELAPSPPGIVLRSLVALVATRKFPGLPAALRLATNCCRDKLLDENDIRLLLTGLEALIEETISKVGVIDDEATSLRASTLTLVRREAARSALVLRSIGLNAPCLDQWITLIPDDPFPEVRSLLDEPGLWPGNGEPATSSAI